MAEAKKGTDSGGELVLVSEAPTLGDSGGEFSELLTEFQPPRLVKEGGRWATYAYLEFFTASLRSENTRKSYRRAVDRFLCWCHDRGLAWSDVSSPVVSEYIRNHLFHGKTGKPLDTQTKKQHLAALRHFYDVQERRHGVLFNPAAAVRGPRHRAEKGKTRPFPEGASEEDY